ncbi:MAG: hypothetical protein JWM11_3659 [Planctomycetaceae bacterium]|nr:hypothetical protein [Planctomycetaceae bacterium]
MQKGDQDGRIPHDLCSDTLSLDDKKESLQRLSVVRLGTSHPDPSAPQERVTVSRPDT